MFVCIVMEYYNQGDLGHLLSKEREKRAAIPEAVSSCHRGNRVLTNQRDRSYLQVACRCVAAGGHFVDDTNLI